MSTRLDAVLRKYPDHETGVRTLAERDPSGNLKYLDWGAKVLASGQALAGEIADVVEMHHAHARGGNMSVSTRRGRSVVRADIYSYRPQDLADLRDALLKIQHAKDKKRRARERLYKLDGAVEAEVIYDSPDLVVRHIKNKPACMHYGLNTKWCIAMRRERYFEDYEAQNATFFFFERKTPRGDEYDKVALMFPRGPWSNINGAYAYTSLDETVDMMLLARVYGTHVFREAYERSERYPGSTLAQVHAGVAQLDTLRAAFQIALESESPGDLLEAICCNDAADATLLAEVVGKATELLRVAKTKSSKGRRYGQRRRRGGLVAILAAAVIHPNVPDDLRKRLLTSLKRRKIDVGDIRRGNGPVVGVVYNRDRLIRRRRRSRDFPPSVLRRRACMFQGMADRALKHLKAAEERAAKKKRKR